MHVSVTSKVQRTENMGSVHYVSDWEHGHCTVHYTMCQTENMGSAHYVSDWPHGPCALCVWVRTWSLCTMCQMELQICCPLQSLGWMVRLLGVTKTFPLLPLCLMLTNKALRLHWHIERIKSFQIDLTKLSAKGSLFLKKTSLDERRLFVFL